MKLFSIIALVALAGCSRCGSRPPPAPTAADLRPQHAPDTLPITDSTLSSLESTSMTCLWVKLDPVAQRRVEVAELDEPCGKRGQVAWSFGGDRAMVVTDRTIFKVDPSTGAARALRPVPAGTLVEVGFDDTDTAVALSLQDVPQPSDGGRPQFLDFEGQKHPVLLGDGGRDALAHAFALDASGWRRVETLATLVGLPSSPSQAVLTIRAGLAPRTGWQPPASRARGGFLLAADVAGSHLIDARTQQRWDVGGPSVVFWPKLTPRVPVDAGAGAAR